MIPIYLIVLGTFGLLRNFMALGNRLHEKSQNGEENSTSGECKRRKDWTERFVDIFLLVWFVCGNVWIYKRYMPSSNAEDEEYCNSTLYLFAYWLDISIFISFGSCCWCICTFATVMECFCGDETHANSVAAET